MAETKRARLLTEERRRAVLEMINRQGRVVVADLSRHFRVSPVTARSDINELSRRNLLVRSHGGAIRKTGIVPEAAPDVRDRQSLDQKVRIGEAAAALVREGQTVLLDSGSTTLEVARAIRSRQFTRVTVVTNSLEIASELSAASGINLIMIGGLFRRISRSFVGPQAQKLLADLRVDHFFLGVDGLDPESGPSTTDILEAELNVSMMRSAKEVTVVADATKIGRSSFSIISPLAGIHRVITDSRIDPKDLETLRGEGIEIKVVTGD
ncbi:MAG: DeoR/GlpR family DNA-binding transcription regulator [Bryobacteraceae bacterium]